MLRHCCLAVTDAPIYGRWYVVRRRLRRPLPFVDRRVAGPYDESEAMIRAAELERDYGIRMAIWQCNLEAFKPIGNAYLVSINDREVFVRQKPDGLAGELVALDYADVPEPWLGVVQTVPPKFKVFESQSDCERAGYLPVTTEFDVLDSLPD